VQDYLSMPRRLELHNS